MENKEHSEIMYKLGSIEGRLDGIINRLDIANGRLNSHAKDIQELNTFKTTVQTRTGIISGVVALGISLAGFFIKK